MSKNNNKDDVMKLVLDKLEKLDEKADKHTEHLHSIDKTLVKQESNLEAHMKRSDLLEQSQNDLKDAVKPILKVYTVAWGILKIVGAIGILVGIVVGIMKIFGL